MHQKQNHRFEQLIVQAGFSITYERERIYKLLTLAIAESANIIDNSDFVNVKYPNTRAQDLLINHFGIKDEQNQDQ
jgi:hypothetical protein